MRLIDISLIIITILSVGNFNEKLLPQPYSPALQQSVTLLLWIGMIYATFLLKPIAHIERSGGIMTIAVFYGFAALSVLWANYSVPSLLKGITIVITTVGVFRLVETVPAERVFLNITHGFVFQAVTSILAVLLLPRIGIVQEWMHNGQWKGIFESKQSLGAGTAMLLFLAVQGLLQGGSRVYFITAALLATACVLGAGSRGGGILAGAAIIVSYFSTRYAAFARATTRLPVVLCIAGACIVSYFVLTGYRAFFIYGEEVNLTNRTLIWQFALSHFMERPFGGWGLNGFWTYDQILADFRHEHVWVLDNFHSGYVCLAMETGIIGFVLFSIAAFMWGRKTRLRIQASGVSQMTALRISYMSLIFLINLTETFFLRSTNIFTSMMIICMLLSYTIRPGVRSA